MRRENASWNVETETGNVTAKRIEKVVDVTKRMIWTQWIQLLMENVAGMFFF